VAQTAIALARNGTRWTGQEIDVGDVEDLDGFADVLRDLVSDPADVVVGFVEEDDEYLGIVRVDGEEGDARVFVSDRRVLETSDLASRLFEDALPVPAQGDDDEEGGLPEADPGGDVALLEDLGIPGEVLLDLLATEGMLPADVVAAICERAGALDVLDEVRG
jgi:putative tRNA adenosine deaminase-associated protein